MFYNKIMKNKFKTFLFLILIIFALPNLSLAAINFTDGFWSTDFDDALIGDTLDRWSYQGLQVMNTYMCGSNYSGIYDTNTDAKGGLGKIFRMYMEGNVRNSMSSSLYVNLPTPQKEFWLRFYYRIPNGQTIGGILEHKIIYAFTDSSVAANVNWPNSTDGMELQMRNTMGGAGFESSPGGWNTVYGSGQSANGTWHYFEFHFDLGISGNNNGVFEMWIDGTRRAYNTGLDFFDGGTASPTGWESVTLPYNHNLWMLDGCIGHDVDEIATALPSYTGFTKDSNDRNMIGGLPSDLISPSAPSGLSVL